MPRPKKAIPTKKKKAAISEEAVNLKLINDALKEKLAKYKGTIEQLARENESLTIENQRLYIKTQKQENEHDFESRLLVEKAKKEKMDNEILNEFIRRCKEYTKEIGELKQETTSLRTRLKEKFDLLTQSEQNSERLREYLESQSVRLKNLANKYETEETSQDYINVIENSLEKSRERSTNLRRELQAQKADFNISLNRFRRKEMYYVDEIRRLKSLNEKLKSEMDEKSPQTEKKMKTTDFKEVIPKSEIIVADNSSESNDSQQYII